MYLKIFFAIKIAFVLYIVKLTGFQFSVFSGSKFVFFCLIAVVWVFKLEPIKKKAF